MVDIGLYSETRGSPAHIESNSWRESLITFLSSKLKVIQTNQRTSMNGAACGACLKRSH